MERKTFQFDPTLYEGRPLDDGNRSARETRTYDFLERLGISFSRVDHDPAATIADCEEIDGLLGVAMCKNLFLCNAQKTAFYLLMLPGEKVFHTKDLSKQINSARLSFADAVYMQELLDILPGAVSVLGLMNDTEKRVRLLVDTALLTDENIGCHPCVNTTSLRINRRELMEIFLPAIGHAPTFVVL